MYKRLFIIVLILVIVSVLTVSSALAADVTISGTFTGDYRERFTDLVCNPNTTPVTFSGSVEATITEGAIMIGLIDKGFHDSDPTATWGSGAYAYFGLIGSNLRVGPSDGFLGGELNQVGANVPYSGGPQLVNFAAEIYAGQIKVTYNGADYVDTYGDLEDANTPDAFPGAEFDSGAYVGIDIFDLSTVANYDFTVSGCTPVDDEGPMTGSVVATPNPVAVGALIDLTANVDDSTTGGSTIASAEYSLDGGAWTAMNAADVAFDEINEDVQAAFIAPADAGIYNLCVQGTDVAGNTGAAECTMLVVYDPDGGFVTGGGWITSPAGAMTLPGPFVVWNQDFSSDASGWFGDGINVSGGVAELESPGGQYSRFDGYRDGWPGTWMADIDVYLDPAWPADQGFDYSVASNGSDGLHQRDFIFHVGTVENYGPIVGKELLVAVDNNTYGDTNPFVLTTRPGGYYVVPAAGWYTLQHVFYDAGGYLAVEFNVLDSNGNVVWTDTRSNTSDTIPGEVGGNRYAWFVHIDVATGIQVDNHQLILDEVPSPEGRANFGFVSKYKKGADTPTGNTEFQFQAGNLNFHSTSYDWLVVTGSDYAMFKGEGTINGENAPNSMPYKFKLWAGDGHDDGPDTFRIKIWYEENDSEIVVYDNGMDQAIGGGNIVVHTKK